MLTRRHGFANRVWIGSANRVKLVLRVPPPLSVGASTMLKRRHGSANRGVRLELCTEDRESLLANVTRIFREAGLNVTRAEISTSTDKAQNLFYVTDAMGNPADRETIEAVRQRVGLSDLKVKELPLICPSKSETEEQGVGVGGAVLLSLGSLVRRNLYNLGLIRSFS